MAWIPAVRGRGIVKRFDDVIALDGIDLDVAPRQIHGLVGPNGAGKTTLLGLAVAGEGWPGILGTPAGRPLTGPDGVSGFVDGPGLYPALTARKNLAALAALRGGGSGTQEARARRAAAARGGTSPTVTGREKSTATSCCTSTGDARNPLWQFDGVVDVLAPTSKG
jgi:ABC-2 type transport system ATP-binding protein